MNKSFNSHTAYYQETFRDASTTDFDLREVEFEDCVFERCRFDTGAFHFCRFITCTFVDCLFISITVPNCTIDEVVFRECKLNVFDWTESEQVVDLVFEKCKIDSMQFGYMDLRKSVFRDSVALNVDFSEANLSEADFSGTELKGSVFLHTNLAKANFVGATHYLIDVTQNHVKKAKFALPEAVGLLRSFDIEIV